MLLPTVYATVVLLVSSASLLDGQLWFYRPPFANPPNTVYSTVATNVVSNAQPKMYVTRVQLACEVAAKQRLVRWVRKGSSAITSTPLTIAEGNRTSHPQLYSVSEEQTPNGGIKSTLTLLQPEPSSSQATYHCQGSSTPGSFVDSKDVYIIGHRQFVNANVAYHAADLYPITQV